MESESGEKLSKNELKRRMKAEKKAAEKAQKAAEKVDTAVLTRNNLLKSRMG